MKLVFKINGENPNPYFGVVEGYILEGINQVSLIELILISEVDLSNTECADYIGDSITLALEDIVEDVLHFSRFDGIIYELHVLTLARARDIFFKYQMIIRPKLWDLNFKVQSRSFANQSKIEVLKKVFKEWWLRDGHDFEICRFKEKERFDPHITQVIQHQVSDLVFVQNLMREAGINYYFSADKIEDKQQKLRLFDHNVFLGEPFKLLKKFPNEEKAVPYRPFAGMPSTTNFKFKIETLERHFRASIMDVVSYCNFGDGKRDAFESELTNVDNGYAGLLVSYGCGGESKDAANQEAMRRAEYLKANQVSYEGRSNFFMFRPGEKYPVGDEFGKPRQNEMNILLTSVFHHFRQTIPSAFSGSQDLEYSNVFFAVDKEAPVRPDQTAEKSIVELKRSFTQRHAAVIADEDDAATRTDIENIDIYNLKKRVIELKHELSTAKDLSGILMGVVIKDAWVSKCKELLCRVKNERFPDGITVKVALGWLSNGGGLSILPRVDAQVYFQFLNGEGGQNEAIMVGYRSTGIMPLMDPAKTTDSVTLGPGEDPELRTYTEKVVGKSKFSPKNKYRNSLLGENGVAEVAVIDGGEDTVYLHANNRICVAGDKSVNISTGTLCQKAGNASMQFDSFNRGVSQNEKVSIGNNLETTVFGSTKLYTDNDISIEAHRGEIDMIAKSKLLFHNQDDSSLQINNDTVSMSEKGGNVAGISAEGILCATDTKVSLFLKKNEKEATMTVDQSFVSVKEQEISIVTKNSSAVFGTNGAAVKTDQSISIESSGGATITMSDGEIRLNC